MHEIIASGVLRKQKSAALWVLRNSVDPTKRDFDLQPDIPGRRMKLLS